MDTLQHLPLHVRNRNGCTWYRELVEKMGKDKRSEALRLIQILYLLNAVVPKDYLLF